MGEVSGKLYLNVVRLSAYPLWRNEGQQGRCVLELELRRNLPGAERDLCAEVVEDMAGQSSGGLR